MWDFARWYLATGFALVLFTWAIPRMGSQQARATWIDYGLLLFLWVPFLAWCITMSFVRKQVKSHDSK